MARLYIPCSICSWHSCITFALLTPLLSAFALFFPLTLAALPSPTLVAQLSPPFQFYFNQSLPPLSSSLPYLQFLHFFSLPSYRVIESLDLP